MSTRCRHAAHTLYGVIAFVLTHELTISTLVLNVIAAASLARRRCHRASSSSCSRRRSRAKSPRACVRHHAAKTGARQMEMRQLPSATTSAPDSH